METVIVPVAVVVLVIMCCCAVLTVVIDFMAVALMVGFAIVQLIVIAVK